MGCYRVLERGGIGYFGGGDRVLEGSGIGDWGGWDKVLREVR